MLHSTGGLQTMGSGLPSCARQIMIPDNFKIGKPQNAEELARII